MILVSVSCGIMIHMARTLGIHALEAALADLGAYLAEHGQEADLFVIGGAAFLLSDPDSAPPTRDVDAAARMEATELVQPVLSRELEDAIAGTLTIRIASRQDLIRLKLRPATLRGDTGARHRQNLIELHPSDDELESAAEWFRATSADPRAEEERLRAVLDEVRAVRDGR